MEEENEKYYEGEELNALVSSTDWKRVLPILYASTRSMICKRFLCDPDKGVLGKTFKDFVHDAVTLFIEGKRRCPKHVQLEHFFIATIRSIISKHVGKHYSNVSIDASDEQILQVHYESINTNFDVTKIKMIVTTRLDKDEISQNIFECWAEGINKPAEIRELYGYSEPDFNNGKKRLIRVLTEIRTYLKNEK